jgi:hypothetical protein
MHIGIEEIESALNGIVSEYEKQPLLSFTLTKTLDDVE